MFGAWRDTNPHSHARANTHTHARAPMRTGVASPPAGSKTRARAFVRAFAGARECGFGVSRSLARLAT
eukprot:7121622-Pyramimonas_sp.AAC.1